MPSVPDTRPAVSPNLTAALLLAALTALRARRLPRPTVEQVIQATGASHSRAYELKDKLLDLLPTLQRPVGRPQAEPAPSRPDTSALSGQVLDFVMQRPGCVRHGGQRRRYSDAFRCFILELAERNRQVPLADFAAAVRVPPATVKDWLRGGRQDLDRPASRATTASTDPVTEARVQTVLAEWRGWDGSFSAFCDHVRVHLRVPFGRTLISAILEQHGERAPRRRAGRSPDEKALRDAFETFFPGAQWQGDGSSVVVQVGQQRFTFNIELMVDAHTDAVVGASVRDEEDAQAVTEAFDDGVQTTGEPPLSILLDNRPSNHTDEVIEGIAPAMKTRATRGRPQNKAHVEGAFGLFAQMVPLLVITATSTRQLAEQFLTLALQTWGRTLNNRPVRANTGASRAQRYRSQQPTEQQVEQAREALQQRIKQQEKAQKTLQARQNPLVRQLLDQAFKRLELVDPEGNIRAAIARYSLDNVINGIATFEGRKQAGTLPQGVDARYLLGIVRNIAQQDEGLDITEALLRLRLEAQDQLLAPLRCSLDELLQRTTNPIESLKAMTDRAMEADRQLDRLFWLDAAADLIRHQHTSRHAAMLRFAGQRIHACFRLAYRERQLAVRFLCTRAIPLR
jgi:hypothetical protein